MAQNAIRMYLCVTGQAGAARLKFSGADGKLAAYSTEALRYHGLGAGFKETLRKRNSFPNSKMLE